MKSYTKSSTNKLVDRFDNELKVLLLNDLSNLRSIKHQFLHSNSQGRTRTRLSVA